MNINETMKEKIKNAKANISIELKDCGCKIAIQGNIAGQIVGAAMLIQGIAEKNGKDPDLVWHAIHGCMNVTKGISCESVEQMEVMQQIMKNGMVPGNEK